jgi:hypothetical protein
LFTVPQQINASTSMSPINLMMEIDRAPLWIPNAFLTYSETGSKSPASSDEEWDVCLGHASSRDVRVIFSVATFVPAQTDFPRFFATQTPFGVRKIVIDMTAYPRIISTISRVGGSPPPRLAHGMYRRAPDARWLASSARLLREENQLQSAWV